MKILVLGSGGREHAIAWALAKSPRCETLYVAPGNGGTAAIAENVPTLDILDGDAVVKFAQEKAIDLVVIGPEAPLVEGIADLLRQNDIAVFGPNASGAALEGSKLYSKQFMATINVPTAQYLAFEEVNAALDHVRSQEGPVVVKADGLAAGKGVVVANTTDEAEKAVRNCFEGAFGDAGRVVVIEECMTGPECSLLAFVTGGEAFCMVPAQDHKRAYDGDKGPNTGGMGSYSPVPLVDEKTLEAMEAIMKQMAAATQAQQGPGGSAIDYRGVLYGGFMLTDEGPKIVEFNVRFGDPETQVVLPRLESDLVDVMEAVALERPADIHLSWSDQWAVCVVLASQGYPGSYEKGKPIFGLDEAESMDGVVVFHAGTKLSSDGQLLTSGGRVLNVVGLGDSFEEARDRAYAACDKIDFEGKQFRSDIGYQIAPRTR